MNDTINKAANVATKVATKQGRKISVGFAALLPLIPTVAARTAITLVGINANPAACKHKNIICALLALVLSGFNSCKLSIALIPKGVAALSNPSILALKFIIICPLAGCPLGTSGNNLEKNGPTIFDKKRIPPAFSAILIKPINKAIIPIKPMQIVTAVAQVAITPSIIFCLRA